MIQTNNWNYPTKIKVGAGRISELAESCNDLGIKKPLLVTDSGLADSLIIQKVNNVLECSLFSGIKANPTALQVEAGVEAYKNGSHDGVIACGGGSALDVGKAIALMAGQKGPIWDFEDIGDNWRRADSSAIAKIIAIPTTAGTGSEVGRASVITDTQNEVKKIIFHPNMMPSLVILDPELTLDLPKHLTAATGMDALSHCLEAYCAPSYHPMAMGIALEGIHLIKENLLKAYYNGQDIEARCNMLVASTMGATSFQRGLGAMHALAHPLGALYDVHHGRLNAILMPYVLEANRGAIEKQIERLSHYLSIANGFDGFLDWIEQLRMELGIEHTLTELGLVANQLDRIAKMATEDPSSFSNPITFGEKDYRQILDRAFIG